MDGSWARYLVIMVVAALVMAALASLDNKNPRDTKGWRQLKPGASYAFSIIGGVLMTLFLAYIWLFVGSSRPDGESQMRILFWMIMAFGGGTLITFFQYRAARRAAIRWRGNRLAWTGKAGVQYSRTISDAVALEHQRFGPVYLVFADGLKLRIDPYTMHAKALIDTVTQSLYPHDSDLDDDL